MGAVMGYQESMVEVSCLAEAAGIRKALIARRDRLWFGYYATERSIRDLELGDPWGTPTPIEDCERVPQGRLYVIVGGDRHPYQQCCGRWSFLDAVQGLEKDNYYDYFEPLDEDRVDAAWDEDPGTAQRACVAWGTYLDYVQDGMWLPEGRWWADEVIYGRWGVQRTGEIPFPSVA